MGVPESAVFGDLGTVETATKRSISQVFEEIHFWHTTAPSSHRFGDGRGTVRM
jgi:hypothetical protein